MTLSRSTFRLLIVATSLAVVAEIVAARIDRLPFWLAIPCAVATGGIVLFTGVGLGALARTEMRPDRRDIADVRDLQHRNAAAIDGHAERLAHAETRLAFLCAQPDLADRLRDVALAGERVETWGAVAADMTAWTAAVERWGSGLERLRPGMEPDMSPPTDAELQAARAALPPTHNFSSPDLKAALAYLVQRERVAAAYDRLQRYGRSLAENEMPAPGATPTDGA